MTRDLLRTVVAMATLLLSLAWAPETQTVDAIGVDLRAAGGSMLRLAATASPDGSDQPWHSNVIAHLDGSPRELGSSQGHGPTALVFSLGDTRHSSQVRQHDPTDVSVEMVIDVTRLHGGLTWRVAGFVLHDISVNLDGVPAPFTTASGTHSLSTLDQETFGAAVGVGSAYVVSGGRSFDTGWPTIVSINASGCGSACGIEIEGPDGARASWHRTPRRWSGTPIVRGPSGRWDVSQFSLGGPSMWNDLEDDYLALVGPDLLGDVPDRDAA